MRHRVRYIPIAVVDGLTGFLDAIGAVFPLATVSPPVQVRGRLCVVHLVRNALAFVSWKDRKRIAPMSRLAWEHVISLIAFPPAIRNAGVR